MSTISSASSSARAIRGEQLRRLVDAGSADPAEARAATRRAVADRGENRARGLRDPDRLARSRRRRRRCGKSSRSCRRRREARQLVSVDSVSFAGRDPFFDEGVPLVAMRALPEQLGTAVAAAHADVRDRGRRSNRASGRRSDRRALRQVQARERLPDGLMERPARAGLARWRRRAAPALRRRRPLRTRCRASASRARQSCGLAAISLRHSSAKRGATAELSGTPHRVARTPGTHARATDSIRRSQSAIAPATSPWQ